MRHIPFMKALAEVQDTSDPVWRDASAGYLVLRFFDRWLDDGPALMSFDQTLPALKARLQSSEDVHPQVQEILLSAVQTMIDAPGTDPALVAGPLLAYGNYLETVGRLQLAAHVYQTIIDAVDSASGCADFSLAAMTLIRYGVVSRLLGEFDSAHDAYKRAEHLAIKGNIGDLQLQSRVGMAITLQVQGNLGESEALLTDVVADASAAGITRVLALAKHGRGVARSRRGRYVEAMNDFFAAYELTEDIDARERILSDLALCAVEAGYRSTARDAYRILAYTGHEPNIRLIGLANLLEITVQNGDAIEFERLQRHINIHAQRYSIPVSYATEIALFTAYGAEQFDTREAAIAAYQAVVAQANTIGMHRIAFMAEERLSAVLAGTPTSTVPESNQPPDSLHHVVDAIAAWGQLAVQTV